MFNGGTIMFQLLYLTSLVLLVKCERKNLTMCCPEGSIVKENECEPYDGVLGPITIYDRTFKKTDIKASDIFQLNVNTSFILMNNANNYRDIGGLTPYLNEEGILYLENPNAYVRYTDYSSEKYCVGLYAFETANKNITEISYWVLFEDEESVDLYVFITSMYISSFFFMLVLLVYAVLPELRNLHGLVLMAYVVSMLAAFLSLATLQLLTLLSQHEIIVCLTFSSLIYFSFLSSFCWMNVMSFDIWWTFRWYGKARPIHRRGELFKFFTYCAYSWGVPLAMTAGFTILNIIDVKHLPWLIVPKIPEHGCFLNGGERFIYLYVPMLIVLTSNWILFLMTGFNIWRLNRETAVLNATGNRSHRSQKQRFMLYLKLSVVMGINWILEVLSSLTPASVIWKILDAYNLLIGFYIFVIFICKRKILNMLKIRFMGKKRRPRSSWRSNSQRSARSTSSSSVMTDSEDNNSAQISLNPMGIRE